MPMNCHELSQEVLVLVFANVDGNMSVFGRVSKKAGMEFTGQAGMKPLVTVVIHSPVLRLTHISTHCIWLASVICPHNQLKLEAKSIITGLNSTDSTCETAQRLLMLERSEVRARLSYTAAGLELAVSLLRDT